MPPRNARAVVWARPEQAALVREAAEVAGMQVVAAGSSMPGVAAAVAELLHSQRADDLRTAAQADHVDLVWLAEPLALDREMIEMMRDAGPRFITSEPLPAGIAATAGDLAPGSLPRFVPLLRRSPGFRAAAQVLEPFGARRCVNVSARCGPGQGSLYARLFDAIDLVDALCGRAEAVYAALASALPGEPESLDLLHGHLTLNLRFADPAGCACVAASDLAGQWFRGVTVLGEGGCLRIDDGGFEWINSAGEIVDSHRERAALSPGAGTSPGALVGVQIRRMLDRMDAEPPADAARIVSICEAARLSARTGQAESPSAVQQILSRV